MVPVAQDAGRALASCGMVASVTAGNVLGLLAVPECFDSVRDTASGVIQNFDTIKKGVMSAASATKSVVKGVANLAKMGIKNLFGKRRLLEVTYTLPSSAELDELLLWAADIEAVHAAFNNSFLVGLVDEATTRGLDIPAEVVAAGIAADVRIKVAPARMAESTALVAAQLKNVSATAEIDF
eukprot:4971128-Pyramimonas_sp.AAC.1